MDDLGRRLTGATSEIDKLAQHRDALKALHPSNKPMLPPPVWPCPAALSGPLPSVEKLRPMLQGNAKDAYKSAYFSDIFDAQMDIMARALTSGITRVATLQAGSADNDIIVPVGRGFPHHVTSHGNQATFSMVQNYYFIKMARLLEQLDVPDPLDPGKTVLDNTLIVLIAECLPVSHSSNGVPTMLLGKAGGKVKAGAYINQSRHHEQTRDGHRAQGVRPGRGALRFDPGRGGAVMNGRLTTLSAVGVLAAWAASLLAAACTGSIQDAGGGSGPGARPGRQSGGQPARQPARQPTRQPARQPRIMDPTAPPSAQVACAGSGPGHVGRRALAPADQRRAGADHPRHLRAGRQGLAGIDGAARSRLGGRLHQQRGPPDRRPRIRARRPGERPQGGRAGLGRPAAGAAASLQRTGGAACAETFVTGFGAKLYRRPLAPAEVARYLAMFGKAKPTDFRSFIYWATSTMLQSPNVIYRTELGEPDGATRFKLTPYEVASELSYAFTGGPPGAELMQLAASNRLATADRDRGRCPRPDLRPRQRAPRARIPGRAVALHRPVAGAGVAVQPQEGRRGLPGLQRPDPGVAERGDPAVHLDRAAGGEGQRRQPADGALYLRRRPAGQVLRLRRGHRRPVLPGSTGRRAGGSACWPRDRCWRSRRTACTPRPPNAATWCARSLMCGTVPPPPPVVGGAARADRGRHHPQALRGAARWPTPAASPATR